MVLRQPRMCKMQIYVTEKSHLCLSQYTFKKTNWNQTKEENCWITHCVNESLPYVAQFNLNLFICKFGID